MCSTKMWKRFSLSYIWKNYQNVEGKEEHGIFVQSKRKLPQTEMWKMILNQKIYQKFVQLKCGRYLQYPTGMEDLLKCGGQRRP